MEAALVVVLEIVREVAIQDVLECVVADAKEDVIINVRDNAVINVEARVRDTVDKIAQALAPMHAITHVQLNVVMERCKMSNPLLRRMWPQLL